MVSIIEEKGVPFADFSVLVAFFHRKPYATSQQYGLFHSISITLLRGNKWATFSAEKTELNQCLVLESFVCP